MHAALSVADPGSDGSAPQPDPTTPRLVRVLLGPLLLTAAAGVASWWPFWPHRLAVGIIYTLVVVSFVAIGLLLRQDRAQRGTGTLMLLAAPCYLVSWWWMWPPHWLVGPIPLVSFLVGYFWFVFGGVALLRYPDARLGNRWATLYFAAMAAWIGVFKLAIALVSRPEWNRFPAEAWWPALFPQHRVHDVLRSSFSVGIAIFSVLLVPLLLRRLNAPQSPDRIDSLPVTVAACAVALSGGAYFVVLTLKLPAVVPDALRTGSAIATLVTPLAFLAVVIRRLTMRGVAADLALRIAGGPSVHDVQAAVRHSLQDPHLLLIFWSPEAEAYVDAAGQPWNGCSTGRWEIFISATDGQPLAVLLVDPTLRRHRKLVESVVAVCGLALENGRLHADVAAQLREVQASRSRIVEGVMAERKRLERDLHDGAQQSLLAIMPLLARARLRAAQRATTVEEIDAVRERLRSALLELRDLARGIYPIALTRDGVGAAVRDIAERLELDVDVVVRPARFSAVLESACYFIVAEALVNVARHARTNEATVSVELRDDEVGVEIRDRGVGGADPGRGSGLAGLVDRARTHGGRATVHSPAGDGTTITVSMPCA